VFHQSQQPDNYTFSFAMLKFITSEKQTISLALKEIRCHSHTKGRTANH